MSSSKGRAGFPRATLESSFLLKPPPQHQKPFWNSPGWHSHGKGGTLPVPPAEVLTVARCGWPDGAPPRVLITQSMERLNSKLIVQTLTLFS